MQVKMGNFIQSFVQLGVVKVRDVVDMKSQRFVMKIDCQCCVDWCLNDGTQLSMVSIEF